MKRETTDNTKRIFIETAYNMILEVGAENVNVRELSQRAGFSRAALYKHFESLEYVLVLASIRFLNDYVKEIKDITLSTEDPLKINIDAWKCFNQYAFANPQVFLNLFWGNYNHRLEEALQEYFELYPLGASISAVAMLCCPLFVGNIEERDYMWMRRAAAEGMIHYDDAAYISRVNCLIVKGMLMEHRDKYRDKKLTEKVVKECNNLIEETIRVRRI